MACRCPGKFFAEAEVALIALLLLSRYRPGLRPVESIAESRGDVICDGMSREQPCLSAKQPEHRDTALAPMPASLSAVDPNTAAGLGSAKSGGSEAGWAERTAEAEQARRASKANGQTLADQEAKHTSGFDAMTLPLPELRRQVGVRWPQRDIQISLGD